MSVLEREWTVAAAELEAALLGVSEREDGPGQRAAKEQLLEALRAELQRASGQPLTREQTLQVVADAGRLIDAHGRPLSARADGRSIRPEPDLAYNAAVNGVNRRVNIEVDSDPRAAAKHLRELRQADRNGLHVAVVVDPVSGATVDGVMWNPATKRARQLSAVEVAALRAGQLPRAVIPTPTLGRPNPAVPPRKPRSPASIGSVLGSLVSGLNPTRKRAGARVSRVRRETEFESAAAEWQAALT